MSLARLLPARRGLVLVLALAVLIVWLGNSPNAAQGGTQDDHPFAQRYPAPSLDGGVEWINTAGPIDLEQLRGKFVLLDFWTYCCINCMHILPELKKLEHAYPNEIVVIGVHSAKFQTEQDSKNIAEAIERYEIEHPVVNDAHHVIWDKYGVVSWPTLCVIDPQGNLVVRQGGELDFETLDAFFKEKMPYYRRKKLLKPSPPLPTGEAAGVQSPPTPLRYPGKVLADEKSDRLYIADSNHNRIVVARLDGTLVETIGSGHVGALDGNYATAAFDHPQGMALDQDLLYVADTENHLLRKVNLTKKEVTTIAGTRKRGHGWPREEEFRRIVGSGSRPARFRFVGPPLKTDLNSPWALWVRGRELYIAMAGPHQIWKMSLVKPEIGPFAGNGREDIVDGPHLPAIPYELGAASFAQPSGLASDGNVLYVADSEGSSIRAVPFNTSANVETVVGTAWIPEGGRLFTFGDVDGQGQRILLQHALDVLYHDGLLYVADTYNNKIKVIDPRQITSKTLAGTGQPGAGDNPAQFDEPAGLAYARGKLYVADTNNHAIRTILLDESRKVATLEIKGLEPPAPAKSDGKPKFPDADEVDLAAAKLKPAAGKVRLQVALALPEGFKINPVAPLRYLVESSRDGGPINREALGKLTKVDKPAASFDIELPTGATTGSENLKISLAYYYCQDGSEGVCKAGSVIWNLPLVLSAEATDSAVRLPFLVRD
ncbi:MAG: thioredoxin-like domain-containing protein [Pirellulales bacterium]